MCVMYVARISNNNASKNTVTNYRKEEYPDDIFIVEKLTTVGKTLPFHYAQIYLNLIFGLQV